MTSNSVREQNPHKYLLSHECIIISVSEAAAVEST